MQRYATSAAHLAATSTHNNMTTHDALYIRDDRKADDNSVIRDKNYLKVSRHAAMLACSKTGSKKMATRIPFEIKDATSNITSSTASSRAALMAHATIARQKETDLANSSHSGTSRTSTPVQQKALQAASKSFTSQKATVSMPVVAPLSSREAFITQRRIQVRQQEQVKRQSSSLMATPQVSGACSPTYSNKDQRQYHDKRRSSAASLAKQTNIKPRPTSDYIAPLHETARQLADNKLAKLQSDLEDSSLRAYYGFGPARRSLSHDLLARAKFRSSTNASSDLEQSNRIRSQMTKLQAQIAHIDATQRDQDRQKLLEAAEKKVQDEMRQLDQTVFKHTGKMSPAMMGDWDTKARNRLKKRRASVQPRPDDAVHVGGGKLLHRSEIDELAESRVKPTLAGINQAVATRHAQDDARRQAAEDSKQQSKQEKQKRRDQKAERKQQRADDKADKKRPSGSTSAEIKLTRNIEKTSPLNKTQKSAKLPTGNKPDPSAMSDSSRGLSLQIPKQPSAIIALAYASPLLEQDEDEDAIREIHPTLSAQKSCAEQQPSQGATKSTSQIPRFPTSLLDIAEYPKQIPIDDTACQKPSSVVPSPELSSKAKQQLIGETNNPRQTTDSSSLSHAPGLRGVVYKLLRRPRTTDAINLPSPISSKTIDSHRDLSTPSTSTPKPLILDATSTTEPIENGEVDNSATAGRDSSANESEKKEEEKEIKEQNVEIVDKLGMSKEEESKKVIDLEEKEETRQLQETEQKQAIVDEADKIETIGWEGGKDKADSADRIDKEVKMDQAGKEDEDEKDYKQVNEAEEATESKQAAKATDAISTTVTTEAKGTKDATGTSIKTKWERKDKLIVDHVGSKFHEEIS